MCLLKPNVRSNNCSHEECKQLSAANKQGCLFSLAQSIKPNNTANSSNTLREPLNSSGTLLQPLQVSTNSDMHRYSNNKVRHAAPLHEDSDDEEQFVLNKKKVRLENNNISSAENKQSTIFRDVQPKNASLNSGLQQFAYGNVCGRQPTLNIYQSINHEINEQGSTNLPIYQITQPAYLPYMQIPQDNNNGMNQNGLFLAYPQNIQPQNMPILNNQPILQNFAQNLKNSSNLNYEVPTSMSPAISASENISKENKNSNFAEMLKDMQSKLVDLLSSQNKMLIDLREKNELVQDTLACLINEVTTLKQTVKQNGKEKLSVMNQEFAIPQQIVDNSREIPNSESLLQSLYGSKQDFKYQIVLKNELPFPVYRERNFKFTIFLTDKEGNLIKNTNRIPLTLAIYTSENVPKYVDVNTSGNKILKGMIDKDLVDGVVTFDKIQIKEVTSHFRNGWIFFVVQPKNSGTVLNNLIEGGSGVMINPQHVKPLIVEKMVVKAKRATEKKAGLDVEEGKEFEIEQTNETQINEDKIVVY